MQLPEGTFFERAHTHTNRLRTRVACYKNFSGRKQFFEQCVNPEGQGVSKPRQLKNLASFKKIVTKDGRSHVDKKFSDQTDPQLCFSAILSQIRRFGHFEEFLPRFCDGTPFFAVPGSARNFARNSPSHHLKTNFEWIFGQNVRKTAWAHQFAQKIKIPAKKCGWVTLACL